jgi:hypothetical protein
MPEQRDPRPMGRGESNDRVSMNEYISILQSLRERGADIPEMNTPEDVFAFARKLGLMPTEGA